MKDHEIALLINDLRDIAVMFGRTQQLRERIHGRLVPEIKRLKGVVDDFVRSIALHQEHEDTAPHSGCNCRLCMALYREQALRDELHALVYQGKTPLSEIEKLNDDIRALTHEGRQGELEQANIGLAMESHNLQEALRAISVESSMFRVDPPMTEDELMEKFAHISKISDQALEVFEITGGATDAES